MSQGPDAELPLAWPGVYHRVKGKEKLVSSCGASSVWKQWAMVRVTPVPVVQAAPVPCQERVATQKPRVLGVERWGWGGKGGDRGQEGRKSVQNLAVLLRGPRCLGGFGKP